MNCSPSVILALQLLNIKSSSSGDDSASGSQDRSAVTHPMGESIRVFPFSDIQSPKAQSDTLSEDTNSTSSNDKSKFSRSPRKKQLERDKQSL